MPYNGKVTRTVSAFRNHQERAFAATCRAGLEEMAVERFHHIIEAGILPLFHQTAERLQDSCVVTIRLQEHTSERPFVLSVAMVISPQEGVPIRQLRQPYPKLEFCLRQKTLRAVILTEQLYLAQLQVEEIDLTELNAAKLEQCVHDFVVGIFR